jgi:hypothetical protein
MTRLLISALLALALATQSRAENTAQKYAAELKKLTDEYLKQVSRKSQAEQTAYEEAAKLYARSAEERGFLSLTTDRLSLAMSRSVALIHGEIGVTQLLFDDMPAYAARDFTTTKEIFGADMNTQEAYLANLESLAVEKTKAQALSTALESLSKKGNVLDFLKDMQAFGAATITQLKYSNCSLTLVRASVIADQQTRLQASLAAAKPADKPKLNNQLNDINDKIRTLGDALDATGVYDSATKTCKSPQ